MKRKSPTSKTVQVKSHRNESKKSPSQKNISELQKYREEGKIEGLAYGILTLFRQDSIKKPAELITNGHLLNLPSDTDELYFIESVIDAYNDNEEKVINLICAYLRGNRDILVASLIKDEYLKWDNYDFPKSFNVSKEQAEKLITAKDQSIENILSILRNERIVTPAKDYTYISTERTRAKRPDNIEEKKIKLSDEDIMSAKRTFPIYVEIERTKMFKALFKDFHNQKKLVMILEGIDYMPFKLALEQDKHSFFKELIEVLPRDRYKKLMVMYDDYSIVKQYVRSIEEKLNNNTIDRDLVFQTLKLLVSIYPQDVAKAMNLVVKELEVSHNDSAYYTKLRTLLHNVYVSVNQEISTNPYNYSSPVDMGSIQVEHATEDAELLGDTT